MKRREALQKLMFGAGTVVLIPAGLISCSEEPMDGGNPPGGGNLEIDLDQSANSNLLSEGGFMVLSGIIIANTGGDEFVALASTCTHKGCTVSYDESSKIFPCPCHGSIFSSTGNVLQGPASTPLKKYPVTKTGNILNISTG